MQSLSVRSTRFAYHASQVTKMDSQQVHVILLIETWYGALFHSVLVLDFLLVSKTLLANVFDRNCHGNTFFFFGVAATAVLFEPIG
jgi:hypothetical protein